ncbi:hypothetical protein DY000_02000817 [Brassica cretica]|uniref:Secreted protein n=1 Tax=Brassica cretica TaxID=69181 RepID=A0ABQ7CMF8_BRACR|nr:hypothetical protein DY000_02000817 [Brassica cretica]
MKSFLLYVLMLTLVAVSGGGGGGGGGVGVVVIVFSQSIIAERAKVKTFSILIRFGTCNISQVGGVFVGRRSKLSDVEGLVVPAKLSSQFR